MDIPHVNRGNYILHIVGGGGRVYEALSPKFDGVYKILLLHTSWTEPKVVKVQYSSLSKCFFLSA